MSGILNTNVSLWDASGSLVTLTAGDHVPEWAVDLIGGHCMEPAAGVAVTEVNEAAVDDDAVEPAAEVADEPNFTAPAAPQTRTRRK